MIIAGLALSSSSCNENKWLEEVPLDFLTPSNAYVTESDFTSAIGRLYTNLGGPLFNVDANRVKALFHPTDLMYNAENPNGSGGYNWLRSVLQAQHNDVRDTWTDFYKVIFDANTIIGRVDEPAASGIPEATRNAIKAEAMFFRAFMYRNLGILFGGVPLVVEESRAPKRDYERASRDEVWAQCIEDLTFAAEHLPEITNVSMEGRVSKAVAYHLLSEIYLITQNWQGAITAATAVIDNPNFNLMTQRFGKRADDPGDVYWDLFRRDNQNRSSGNRESLWVRQYEHLVAGGGTSSRWAVQGQTWYSTLQDANGVALFVVPVTAEFGGRGVGILTNTDYMNNQIWAGEDFDNDIRNSPYNIMRDIRANNPESPYYGQYIVASGSAAGSINNDLNRRWTQIYTKLTPIGAEFPAELYTSGTPSETGTIINTAQNSYTDHYIFRLAETYLLRAEAHLGAGNQQAAANDINVVRARANASPVLPGDVTIDYILDERARELHYEEFRSLTLRRLGKYVERTKAYNPHAADYVDDYHELWPIPQTDIETNIGFVLTQNPGY